MKVLVVGASGFVGTSLIAVLVKNGHRITGVSRRVPLQLPKGVEHAIVDIGPQTDWGRLLTGVESVVHLADGFNAFEHIAAGGHHTEAGQRQAATINLARAAIGAGVKNFTYLSTLKAMAGSFADEVLSEGSPARPASLYGQLKLATEKEISRLAAGSSTRVVNLRFPIVFGARADGNFTRLLQLADSGFPLPFSGVGAKRSMISLASLTDAVATTIDNQSAPGGTCLVQDGAMTVAQIIRVLRLGMDRPTRLFYLPEALMAALSFVPGARGIATRLLKPLEINDELFRRRFGWRPPREMTAELKRAAIDFKAARGR